MVDLGDSYDNALAESVIGLYKTELIHKRAPWKDRDQVKYATLEYVDWFNRRRLLEPIEDIPPTEKDANHYRDQKRVPLAGLKQNTLRQTRYGSRRFSPRSLWHGHPVRPAIAPAGCWDRDSIP